MIYTVTLNPSIDYVVQTPEFVSGGLNRASYAAYFPGGKGNNVSMVLKNLGVESTATGFAAGFTGDAILMMLQERGIAVDYIRLAEGNSRINVKLYSVKDGTESEINGSGPKIDKKAKEDLFQKLAKMKDGDCLVLAGNIPETLPNTIYEEICAFLADKELKIVVDAEKKLLEKVLKYRPYLIKPNHHELGEMFGAVIRTKEEAVPYARKLQQMGAQNVMVSMASEGAVLLTSEGETLMLPAPSGEVVNSVGSGDSMVAGFLAGCLDGRMDVREAFEQAVCCGSACAFMQGLPQKADVDRMKDKMRKSYE